MSTPTDNPPPPRAKKPRLLWWLVRILVCAIAVLATLWAIGALWFDFPFPTYAPFAAGGYLVSIVLIAWFAKPFHVKWLAVMIPFLTTLTWWLTLQPRQFRDWKHDCALLPFAKVHGDLVTIRNIRDFAYTNGQPPTPHYITRTYDLRQLKGMDIFLNYWGTRWMAHPILSFDFGDQGRICFSIEARYENGESYSTLGSLYRRFELTCIAATEQDIIRLRTNQRTHEDTYLYHLHSSHHRQLFLDYIALINRLRTRPQWYNAVTSNCTTTIRHFQSYGLHPYDWRLLINGFADEMLYDNRLLDTSVPFDTLRANAHIDSRAATAPADSGFSQAIR